MKAQTRDTFVRKKPKRWLLDDVETEEASGFGIWADFVEEKRGVSQKLIWRKLEQEGLNEAGR